MNKKVAATLLSSLILLNNVSVEVQAVEAISAKTSIEAQNDITKDIVYLKDGEGSLDAGNGTKENPYRNIRTALNNIKNGQTLKIQGLVSYTKYKTMEDKSVLPLLIEKNITIEGNGVSDILCVRAPIQLGSDVTFKNMKLEMVTEVSLGKSSDDNIEGRLLGEQVQKAATIYVAGHRLTLDNVNTKLGTSPNQDKDRPYISGGTYKDNRAMGEKSIINIVNPNAETKISAIYAGDYWRDRNLPVEINIDGKLIDTEIHVGGPDNVLFGNVVVNVAGTSNITGFDRTNHIGNLDVNIKDRYNTTTLNLEGINKLNLGVDTRVSIPTNGCFSVKDITFNKDSVVDFRYMNENPIVSGNLKGVEGIDNPELGGAVILNNEQTLVVEGQVTGLTRLNENKEEYIARFKDEQKYVKADINSTGTFSIDGSRHSEFKLDKVDEEGSKVWKTRQVEEKDIFGGFDWVDGDDTIVNPQFDDRFYYPIKFIDDEGNTYKPNQIDLNTKFTYKLTKPDGVEITPDDDDDWDVMIGVNDQVDDDQLYELEVIVLEGNKNGEYLNKELTLTVIHNATQEKIEKKIYIIPENKDISGDVEIDGNIESGEVVSANVLNLSSDCKEVEYKWYINNKGIAGANLQEILLTDEYIGQCLSVEVTAKNYSGVIKSQSYVVNKSTKVVNTAPELELSLYEVVTESGEKINLLDYVQKSYDAEEGNLTAKYKINSTLSEEEVLNTPGVYEVTYLIEDKEGLTDTKTLRLIVKEKEAVVEPEVKPEVKPEEKPEVKPEEKPEVKPEEKPEVKPEEKPEVKPEEKPEVKPEEKPEVKPEEKPEVKPEEKPEVKPEEKPEIKPQESSCTNRNEENNDTTNIIVSKPNNIVIEENSIDDIAEDEIIEVEEVVNEDVIEEKIEEVSEEKDLVESGESTNKDDSNNGKETKTEENKTKSKTVKVAVAAVGTGAGISVAAVFGKSYLKGLIKLLFKKGM